MKRWLEAKEQTRRWGSEIEGVVWRRQREEGRDEIEEEHCSKSLRVIVLSSCAQGGAVSSLMDKEWGNEEKGERHSQGKRREAKKTYCTSKDFQCICTSRRVFSLTCSTHTRTHGRPVSHCELQPSNPPPTNLPHSAKQNKFCLLNSRMWTPSSALYSPQKGSQDSRADWGGS